jgi:hypothetical protein
LDVWDQKNIVNGSMSIIIHTAYHLGEIWQALWSLGKKGWESLRGDLVAERREFHQVYKPKTSESCAEDFPQGSNYFFTNLAAECRIRFSVVGDLIARTSGALPMWINSVSR